MAKVTYITQVITLTLCVSLISSFSIEEKSKGKRYFSIVNTLNNLYVFLLVLMLNIPVAGILKSVICRMITQYLHQENMSV